MALECHKNVHQIQSGLSILFKRKAGGRVTRQSNNMIVDRTRTDFGCRPFSIRGPDYWNKLLENLTQIENFNKFKSEIMGAFALFVDHRGPLQ